MKDEGEPWWRPLLRGRRQLEGDEEWLARLAYTGLLEGDLLPLATFLKAGYDLEPLVRKRLVEMIEGQTGAEFTLATKKARRGPGNQILRHRARAQRMEIAAFVRENERSHGKKEAAVQAACDEFDVSRSYVFKALEDADDWGRAFSIDLEPFGRAIESMNSQDSEDR